jgi:hypothetical protein
MFYGCTFFAFMLHLRHSHTGHMTAAATLRSAAQVPRNEKEII